MSEIYRKKRDQVGGEQLDMFNPSRIDLNTLDLDHMTAEEAGFKLVELAESYGYTDLDTFMREKTANMTKEVRDPRKSLSDLRRHLKKNGGDNAWELIHKFF